MTRTSARLLAAAAVAGCLLAGGARAQPQPTKPEYLPYVKFSPADTPQQVSLKHAYNEAVQRYNQARYDYLVTLERHNRLVDVHNTSTDPTEKKRAREEAQPLRAKLEDLRRSVTVRAGAVDQAARRAAAGGVSITP